MAAYTALVKHGKYQRTKRPVGTAVFKSNAGVELSKRGIKADTCAWTPWLHESAAEHGSRLGIDSMALFVIGGGVLCKMPWDIDNIGELLKAAACVPGEGPQLRHKTIRVEDKPKGYDKGRGKNKPAPHINPDPRNPREL